MYYVKLDNAMYYILECWLSLGAGHSEEKSKPVVVSNGTFRVRHRKALPMVFEINVILYPILACPDTSSYDNIMSLETAQRLGFLIEESVGDFRAANGRVIVPVGKTTASCSFATGTPYTDPKLESAFHVFHIFRNLPVPLIMGLRFLQITETWTKYRDRLVEEVIPMIQSPRVYSIGKYQQCLTCKLDEHVGLANVDTGSDVNLVSVSFAETRNFDLDEEYHEVMLANGISVLTRGRIRVKFAVGLVQDAANQTIDVEFHIFADLSSDILIRQNTIQELKIFELHSKSLITSTERVFESEQKRINPLLVMMEARSGRLKINEKMLAARLT
ncbi:hypothetical protein F4820DRAFT_471943 [Hypoxylon rubiginosum]|uniref:Uncharacterized protein n=1 Tax=Hypoxylon rubiginosum TaxID=110542 RepID=A0ACB9YUZ4_9PEZI|nr:hypothetical protein F4820DRAFT_471943 [Hypoxylon rubiginosum]